MKKCVKNLLFFPQRCDNHTQIRPGIKPDIRYDERKEVFRLRNKDDLQAFRDNTENADDLIASFKTDENINIQGRKWLKKTKRKNSSVF